MIQKTNILPIVTASIGAVTGAVVNNINKENKDKQTSKSTTVNPLEVMDKSPQTLSDKAQVINNSQKEKADSINIKDFKTYDDYYDYVMKNESLDFSEKVEKLKEWGQNDFYKRNDTNSYYIEQSETVLTPKEIEKFSKMITHPDLKTLFYNMKDFYAYGDNIVMSSANIITDIQSEYDSLQDDIIKDYVDKKLKQACQSDEKNKYSTVQEVINAIDAYHQLNDNMAENASVIMCGGVAAFYNSEQAVILKKIKKATPDFYLKFRQYIDNSNNPKSILYAGEDFKNGERTSALERIKDKEILDYMYEKYYVGKINEPSEIKTMLRKINKETGCKILLSSHSENKMKELALVYKELLDWKKVSNGKAKLPKFINFSFIKSNYITENSGGIYDADNIVYIRGQKLKNIVHALRHELIHSQDTKRYSSKNIQENELINSIIVAKTIIKDGKKQKILDFDNCKYREEFVRAGIEPAIIRYAYTNRAEFIAVAGEGDCSRYSDEFKKILIKFGMPKEALELPCMNKDYLMRAKIADEIIKSYGKKQLPKYDKFLKLIEMEMSFREEMALLDFLF